ncbi:hypothetical protein J4Q44_G00246520 [Coregonus suidteri]|uniref:Solute carrier family 46 member 3 n=1 Tax=Coregonus suidteri TaxID=861788 RepID=A0AAN8QY50_9TELE
MVRVFLIEPVVGVYAFSMFMLYPLIQQYVYRRLWQQLAGSPYPAELNYTHCSDRSTNISSIHQEIQKEASLFLLYSELCFLFPSLLSSLLLVSYSDHCGRKVALVPPLVGELFFALCYATVSHLSLSLGYLLGASFLAGTAGFTWPFITAAIIHLINLVYTAWVLQETVVTPSHTDSSSSSSSPTPSGAEAGSAYLPQRQALIGRLQGVYLLFTASPRRRKTVLGLILAAFAFYKVSKLGGMSIFILYELNAPLCWSEVLVGYGSALSTLIYLGSFAGVSLLSRCLRDGYIVLLGLLSVAAGLLTAAFAKNTLLMFLVRLPLLLSIMPAPVLRSMMSKIVLSSEQGAVFACVAFVEMLRGLGYRVQQYPPPPGSPPGGGPPKIFFG